DEQQVVGLEIHRNRVLRVEQDFVVLPHRKIEIALDLSAHLDDAARNGGNLGLVRKDDAAARLLAALVFADQDPPSQRFYKFVQFTLPCLSSPENRRGTQSSALSLHNIIRSDCDLRKWRFFSRSRSRRVQPANSG